MKWIGLTGGIASGKSTVSEIIEKSGVPVVNADNVAHLALRPDSSVYPKIVQAFGPGVVAPDKTINREYLGGIIFKDASQREVLEKIVHPFVRDEVAKIRKQLAQQGHKVAVYDVPLLFEKNMEKDFDDIVLVYCDPEIQIQRLMQRNSLTREQAEMRISAQIPLTEKKRKAKNIIDNSRTLKDLEKQVIAYLKVIRISE